jgi:hypothetical protein
LPFHFTISCLPLCQNSSLFVPFLQTLFNGLTQSTVIFTRSHAMLP